MTKFEVIVATQTDTHSSFTAAAKSRYTSLYLAKYRYPRVRAQPMR